jgi:fructose-bisphosphate aldolase, class II
MASSKSLGAGRSTYLDQLLKNMVDGAVALADYAHIVAKNYNVNIALHTDHCPAEKLDGFMRPLLDFGAKRIKEGKGSFI